MKKKSRLVPAKDIPAMIMEIVKRRIPQAQRGEKRPMPTASQMAPSPKRSRVFLSWICQP